MRDIAQIFAVEERVGLVGDAEGDSVELGLSFDDLLVDELIEEFEIAPRSVSQRYAHLIAHFVRTRECPNFYPAYLAGEKKVLIGCFELNADDAVDFVALFGGDPDTCRGEVD